MPCIVGAGLAPALDEGTREYFFHSPAKSLEVAHLLRKRHGLLEKSAGLLLLSGIPCL